MVKRRAKPAPVQGFQPYVLRDPASVIGGRFGRLLVAARTFCGVRIVERVCNIPDQIGVRERIIMDWQLPAYPVISPEEFPLQSLLSGLKEEMLLHGASPEAVQLVGALSPFSEEELSIMAGKLKTKSAAKPKADPKAKAPKADAKAKAPKAKKDTAEADGKRAALYAQSIKVKNKDHGARAGTNRANMLDIVLKAKTVGEAIENGATMVDVRFAESKDLIELK